MLKKCFHVVLGCGLVVLAVAWPRGTARSQADGYAWTPYVNVSKTPTASTFPCIAADAAGNVHVLWSEDVGGKTKNFLFNTDGTPMLDARGLQINYLNDTGNTLYYTRWDGQKWLTPVDVQVSLSGRLQYPQAAIDERGMMHVIWVDAEGGETNLVYSQVWASKAQSAREWSEPIILADSVLYANYPADLVVTPGGGVHVIYSHTGADPGVSVVHSADGGKTWSGAIGLYRTSDANGVEDGAAPVRLLADGKGRLHATWSHFGSDGNGKSIYYARSTDQGRTWSDPAQIAAWQPGWYEVDWLSAGVLGDEVHLVWEGSDAIAFQNERISTDGGLTWGAPHQILSKLRGENGFADMVVDSAGQLRLLVVQRADPAAIAHGVWIATWDKDQWGEPVLLGAPSATLYSRVDQMSAASLQDMMRGLLSGNGLRYQRTAVVNGNELFVVVVNEWDGEIWSSHTPLDAPRIAPQPYPEPTALPSSTPSPAPSPIPISAATPRAPSAPLTGNQAPGTGDPLMIASIAVLLILAGAIVVVRLFRRASA